MHLCRGRRGGLLALRMVSAFVCQRLEEGEGRGGRKGYIVDNDSDVSGKVCKISECVCV